jgi:hypothetical protein
MSSPFLHSFTEAIVGELIATEGLEISAPAEEVVTFVAERLGAAGEGKSLISNLVPHLLACPGVDDLYVDDAQLKQMVTDLPNTTLRRGTP